MCWERTTTLASGHDAPRQARRFVQSTFSELLGNDAAPVVDDVVLVTSELVANAVDAQSSRLILRLDVHHTSTTVVVEDDAPGTPTVVAPTETDERGRGLVIVSRMATGWGVQPADVGKQVWARLPVDPPFERDRFSCEPSGDQRALS